MIEGKRFRDKTQKTFTSAQDAFSHNEQWVIGLGERAHFPKAIMSAMYLFLPVKNPTMYENRQISISEESTADP